MVEKSTEDLDKVFWSTFDWDRIFDSVPELAAVIDTESRFVRVNSAFADRLGVPKEQIIGKHCYDLVHGHESVPVFCPHAKTMLTGTESHAEIAGERMNGIFDVTTTPLFRHDGELAGSLHIARDITVRKKKVELMEITLALGEYAMNHSLADLLTLTVDKAELITGSTIGFFHFLDAAEMNVSQQIWSTNTTRAFCTADKLAGHYPVNDAGVWVDCLHERRPVIHNDYSSLKHRRGLPQGHSSLIRQLTIPILKDDKVVAILGVGNKAKDYTEEDVELLLQLSALSYEFVVNKRLKEALEESEQYARALLNAIPDLIFRMNSEGVYLDYKAAREDLYFQADTIVGKRNRDLTPGHFADMIQEKISRSLETGQMIVFEYELVIPVKGLRFFEARMVPNGPDEVTAIARDITDRKLTERSLKKKIEELEWHNNMMVDRELKMMELKQEVNDLLKQSGVVEKYTIHQ